MANHDDIPGGPGGAMPAGTVMRRNWADTAFQAVQVRAVGEETSADITDATTTGKAVLTAANAAAARSAIGAGTSSFSGAYADLTGTPAAASFSQSAVSRSLDTVFVPSSTRNTLVSYSVDIAATLSLTTGQSGTVFLEISANGSTGWTEIARFTNGNSGTLAVGLGLTQTVSGCMGGAVPAGWSVRLRTANNTGTPTFTYRSGQEATL